MRCGRAPLSVHSCQSPDLTLTLTLDLTLTHLRPILAKVQPPGGEPPERLQPPAGGLGHGTRSRLDDSVDCHSLGVVQTVQGQQHAGAVRHGEVKQPAGVGEREGGWIIWLSVNRWWMWILWFNCVAVMN